MGSLRYLSLGFLFLFSWLSISHSIDPKGVGVGFSIHNDFIFDLRFSFERILIGACNISHIKGFFVMSLLGLMAFRKSKLIYSLLFVLFLSLITETLQGWTPARHGRLTDMVPNILGYLSAVSVYGSFHQLRSRFFKSSKKLKCV